MNQSTQKENINEKEEEENNEPSICKETEIKPNEIFSFNLWLFITIGYFFYMALCLFPQDFFVIYLKIDFLPDKYWFTAVPTHILVSLIVIFLTVKGFELIKTIDNPSYNTGLKELSLKEMKKEIEYDYKEGILPDSGDLSEEVVKKVFSMNKE